MRRGEIWRINLDPTIGAEIRKTRPVIIVNDDEIGILPLKVIVPITDWKSRYEEAVWMTKIEPSKKNGLSKTSSADAFQVRSVSQNRFIEKLGAIKDENLVEISESLALVLKIQ
jgi:mRNA interferase MazF